MILLVYSKSVSIRYWPSWSFHAESCLFYFFYFLLICINLFFLFSLDMMVHAFDPSMWGKDEQISESSGPAWSTLRSKTGIQSYIVRPYPTNNNVCMCACVKEWWWEDHPRHHDSTCDWALGLNNTTWMLKSRDKSRHMHTLGGRRDIWAIQNVKILHGAMGSHW